MRRHCTIWATIIAVTVTALPVRAAGLEEISEPHHVLFATSNKYAINPFQSFPPTSTLFGSIDAAEVLINIASTVSGMQSGWDGTDRPWKAILSSEGNDAIDRISISGPVYNTNGDLLAAGPDEFWFRGNLDSPIGFDEFGVAIPDDGTLVWTGTANKQGTWALLSCGNWDDASVGQLAVAADANLRGNWMFTSAVVCNDEARLYGISPLIIQGDTNQDEQVDELDFRSFATNFGNSVTRGYFNGDFDNDGFAGLSDLLLLQANFGIGVSVVESVSVPEPSSLLLLLFCLLMLCATGGATHFFSKNSCPATRPSD